MFRAFKYRIYPTDEQKVLLEKHFGCNRFIFNLALETKITAYQSGTKKNLSRFDLQKQLPELKNEFSWLKDVNSQTLTSSLADLDDAFKRFFKHQNEFPKFKKKSTKESFAVPQHFFIKHSKLSIPKLREGISIVVNRSTKGKMKSCTISKTPSNKYFVSTLCETKETIPEKLPIKKETSVGIDLGLKDFAILSDGTKIENPKYLKTSQSKIKHLQKELSRKTKGSNRYNRARINFAQAHEKVTNQRTDFLHKLSDQITNDFDTICIENLNVARMVKNHHLAQSISDVSWSTFTSMLSYKSTWKGKNLLKIGRFEPSSKICNDCGYIFKELTLDIREWTCPDCGVIHDRDINAASNIRDFALQKYLPVERWLMDVEAGSMDDRVERVLTPKKYPPNESSKICLESDSSKALLELVV